MAQSFWPGQSFRTSVTSDTGEADVWREAARLAATAGNVATNMYLKDGQDQLSTAEIQIKAEEAKLAEALQNEQDQNKYDTILAKHEAAVAKFRPEHSLAGSAFDKIVASKSIDWGTAKNKAVNDRLSDKLETKLILSRKQGIESGDLALYERQEMAGVALYGWDESKATERIETTRHLADRRKMESVAGNDPEWILENMKTPAEMKKHFPNSDPADFTYIAGLATNQKNRQLQREDAAMSAFYTDVSKKAEEGMPFEEISGLIKSQPGLTVKEREKAMTVFNSAASTWGRGGTREDPWKTTQNYNALMEMQIKISRGEPVTEMDIWRAQAAQPEKGPLFSRSDGLNLISQLPDNKDPIMKTTFAVEWGTIAYNIYATEKVDNKNVIPEDSLPEYQSTQNAIDTIIKKNGLDFGKSQKEIKEVLEPIRKERANKTLSKIWGFLTTSPLTTAIRIGQIRSELSEARKQSAE